MKKVFIFSSVHLWNDTRVFFKESVSLAKKYEVELHAPADFDFKEENGVKIFGLPKWGKRLDRRKIRKELWKRVMKSDADIFHFHDPELIFHGIGIKIFKKKKVIYDVHENYIETIRTKEWLPLFIRYSSSIFYKLIERICENIFDKFILAEESYEEIIAKNYVIIRNYPQLKDRNNNIRKKYDVAYLGGITKIRGIFELIEVAKLLKEKNSKFKMLLIGPIEEGIKVEINKEIIQNKLKKNILLTGRISIKNAICEIKKAKIGISILHSHKNYLNCIPTKIFEYMECSIPIIYSNFPDWQKKLNKYEVGLPVDPTNIKDIANAIENLLKNPLEAKKMGENGRKAVEGKYNWKNEEKKLLILYEALLK